MSNAHDNDDQILGELIREAGDPAVSPDADYAQTLRAMLLGRLHPSAAATGPDERVRSGDVTTPIVKGTRSMKRVAQLAVAAIILVALGIPAWWMTIGGGAAGIAFADVAKALDSLRTATFDETVEVKNPMDGKVRTMHAKSLFLAPSHQRSELEMVFGPGQTKTRNIMIMDFQAGKAISLLPDQKMASTVDISNIKRPAGTPTSMFEMVRQLVREGSVGGGEKVESLGKKELDGRVVVGFRTRSNLAEMTFWAEPQTARPVRVEVSMPSYGSRGVMTNFRYDMQLDPALFSLKPPAGYRVGQVQLKMPVEDDLRDLLRLVAEHNNGVFPPMIGMSKESLQAVQAESEKLLKTPEAQKRMEKLKAQYGKDKDGFMKAWTQEWTKMVQPITQKPMQGVMFYMMLRPENDSHYTGKDVKLGTPDRAIFWYKPTGAQKYRVIYADLGVKELSPDEVKKLPTTKAS